MDYLLKPACPEDVEQIVQKLEDQLSRQSLGYNKY
jgi:YesN/AraC family two-component response regulator